jgi:hemoglobin
MGDEEVEGMDDQPMLSPRRSVAPSWVRRPVMAGMVGLAVLGALAWAGSSGLAGQPQQQQQQPTEDLAPPVLPPDSKAILQMTEAAMRSDDPGMSLFDQLGGAYATSTVVDRFMDTIMVDSHLNKNPRIAEFHQPSGHAGFKYLVWELINQATGGPAKYSGRSMKESHWHLRITNEEWNAFVKDFIEVLNYYKVPQDLKDKLLKIAGSTKGDIVNENTTFVPAPPLPDADADPTSLYKRLGGIYAISAVSDKFIDTIMVDPKLNENPKVALAHHKVAPAGFKNMVTQFLAAATGGPQVYTGRSMHESHWNLMITPGEWGAFAADFGAVLDDFNVPAKEKGELFALMGPIQPQVTHNDIGEIWTHKSQMFTHKDKIADVGLMADPGMADPDHDDYAA